MDVHLVSCRELPEPDPDAAPLRAALAAAGIDAAVRAWDDPAVDWSAAPLAVLRSSWNYPRHAAAFAAWIDATARRTALWNPPGVLRWNLHKRYLLELARRGVRTVPTALVARGAATRVAALRDEHDWRRDLVIKPAVSAASLATRRFAATDDTSAQAHLSELAATGDVLVQPFLPAVEGHGERALMWIDGELTHAVRKSPRFSGEAESVSPRPVPISTAEAALAERAIAAARTATGAELLYARVDVAPLGGDADAPVVMELELLEPSLFFDQSPAALERFVDGVARRRRALR